MRGYIRGQRGQVIVLAVVLIFCLAGAAALAVDVGTGYVYRERCEYAAQSAALAAAAELPDRTAAAAAAGELFAANGLDAGGLEVTTPYQGDVRRVCVSCADDRPTYLARLLGINFFRVGAAAVARQGIPAAFDYAMFSGSTTQPLNVVGTNVAVSGHVHGNDTIDIRGANVNVTGNLEAADEVDIRGSSVKAGAVVDGAPFVPMPEYSANELRAECAHRYAGDQHWSGENINVSGGIFVDGDLMLSGVNISGRGMIVVTGEIELCGTNFRYQGASDAVCVYSLDRIKITGVNYVADGILYAPHGEISCHGTNLTVNGAVIGDSLDFGGTNVTVNHDPDAPAVFPGEGAKLVR